MSRAFVFIKTAAILIGGAVVLWVATGVTLDLTLARTRPALVLDWWPVGVQAKVAEGQAVVAEANRVAPEKVDRVRAQLRAAALREPVNSNALGALAALADYRRDRAGARALFRVSETLSRRNTFAQLWLIEDAVARDDSVEALKHYDRAMRVSPEARVMLLPILLTASSDPAIRKELLPLLAQRPLWWKDYVQRLAQEGDNPQVMADVLRAIRLDIRQVDQRSLAEDVLRRMVSLNDERRAMLAANHMEGLAGSTRSLRGGDFEPNNSLLPFTWWMRDETSIRAYRDIVPNGSLGLRVVTSAGNSGGVAQQLFGLSPGHYVFQGQAGDVSADPLARPALELACARGAQLARFVLPASDENGRSFRFAFDVPATDCAMQSISLVTAPAVDTDMWLDSLAITR
ncbi:hypothetical protein [Sphingomonas hengshuiensis]|uniref:Tetratricopeptide repeat protein n=1 Tax=Sphingomonas hengshuiensis TaxID=1609977 RepID=A0A7U5CV82_9SPHN|nr:hypothetical protein [Sphingomonas hengshuiensis]AJP74791.1 hypothetical protein TS85_23720 [Sphingomonas hengshuiensis]